LCFGYPSAPSHVSMRLPPSITVHADAYDDSSAASGIAAYDMRRERTYPHRVRSSAIRPSAAMPNPMAGPKTRPVRRRSRRGRSSTTICVRLGSCSNWRVEKPAKGGVRRASSIFRSDPRARDRRAAVPQFSSTSRASPRLTTSSTRALPGNGGCR